MDRDYELDKKSMSYIPTWSEMKLPQDLIIRLETCVDDPVEAEMVEKEYQKYVDAWQVKHREKLRKTDLNKNEVKSREVLTHWFATLPTVKVIELINDTRHMVDEVLDARYKASTASWELVYIENLRSRVKHTEPVIEQTTVSKLKRFPKYDIANDSLHGAAYSFYRMWAHCFKSDRSKKSYMNSKFK